MRPLFLALRGLGRLPVGKAITKKKLDASRDRTVEKNGQQQQLTAAQNHFLLDERTPENGDVPEQRMCISSGFVSETTPTGERVEDTAISSKNVSDADFDSFLSSSLYNVVYQSDVFETGKSEALLPVTTRFFSDTCFGGIDGECHMDVFNRLLAEFSRLSMTNKSDVVYRRFKFCGQKGKQICQALYSYKQSLWYEIPLYTLCSTLVPDSEGSCGLSFAQACLCLPFNSIDIQVGITMHMDVNPDEATLKRLAEFSHSRRDLYAVCVVDGRQQQTDVAYFAHKFGAAHTSFAYAQYADGTVLALMTFVCYKTTCGNNVVNILTTQSDNASAKRLCGQNLIKGLGDQMFVCIIKMLQCNGGGHIYAECVTTGMGAAVWKAHPMQESCIGNFIWLQLAIAADADLGCEPKTLSVAPVA